MEYYSLNQYLRDRFGEKLYKLSLDGGMTCPNRDGTLGDRGCIFCLGGSGAFSEPQCGDISMQIERAKERIAQKTDAWRFIAYFQSYTNTYAPVNYLERLFMQTISHPDIAALCIGTRPDCLGDDVIELLARLNCIKPTWVELGLQTVNESTARLIRRGYPLSVFDDAMARLTSRGIEAVVHMIIGLPGETPEDMERTAVHIAKSGAKGIKLQLLHVLRGTDLALMYERGEFEVLSKEAYIELVCRLLSLLPPDMVIHRLTGDGDKAHLIAPMWSANKKDVLNSLTRAIKAYER